MLQDIQFPSNGFNCVGKLAGFAAECQQQNQWCWAAVAVSIARYFERTSSLTQCALATSVLRGDLHGADCCSDLIPLCLDQNPRQSVLCDRPRSTGDALFVTGNVGGPAPLSPLGFDDIKQRLGAGSLIACGIDENGGSHASVIYGYLTATKDAKTLQFVVVADPLFPSQISPLLYADFVSDSVARTQWRDSWVANAATGNNSVVIATPSRMTLAALQLIVDDVIRRAVPELASRPAFSLRVVSLRDAAVGGIFSRPPGARRFFLDLQLPGLCRDVPLSEGQPDWSKVSSVRYRVDPRTVAPEAAAPIYLEIPALHIRALELPSGAVMPLEPVHVSLRNQGTYSPDQFIAAVQPAASQVLEQVAALNERLRALRRSR
jgi:hypothetical protein